MSDYPLKNLDLVELELRQLHASEDGPVLSQGPSDSRFSVLKDLSFPNEKDCKYVWWLG